MAITLADLMDPEKGRIENSLALEQYSRKGLSKAEIERIMEYTGLTFKEVARILPISERQLRRYEAEGPLRKDASDHLLQVMQLYSYGYEVFGDRSRFQAWMKQPLVTLGSTVPFTLLQTGLGIQLLQDELGRIEYGIIS